MNTPEPIFMLGQSQAYNVVNGAQEIFGALDFGNSKNVARRYIYATRLEEIELKLENIARSIVTDNTVQFGDDKGDTITKLDPEIIKESGVLMKKAANVQMKAAKSGAFWKKTKLKTRINLKQAQTRKGTLLWEVYAIKRTDNGPLYFLTIK